ncbi:MAG: hypothetical protein ABR975_03960 [Vulcanimicrobiaceae bacterium]|jgi:hypothetical protein
MSRLPLAARVLAAPAALVVLLLVAVAVPHRPLAQAASPNMCTLSGVDLTLAPTMPAGFHNRPGADGQSLANCIAWQEFIYLNWAAVPNEKGIPNPSASPAQFGVPNSQRTVWVSFDRPVNIFPTPGPQAARPTLASEHASGRNPRTGHLVLGGTSEFINNAVQFSSTGQAFTGGWIVGQGTVAASSGSARFAPFVFYDIWVDTDEEGYILGNDLEYITPQSTCAAGSVGLSLPTGVNDRSCSGKAAKYGQGIGAIEVKAALLDLGPYPMRGGAPCAACAEQAHPTFFLFPEPVDLNYPNVGLQTSRLVGLVGFHIVRKLPGAQRMLWATFEHVSNDPDAAQAHSGTWSFFNPASNAAPNVNPNPCPSAGCDYGPSQILREMTIPAKADEATSAFRAVLPASSVFRYYELVNVQWPAVDFPLVPGASMPADDSQYGPPVVANTVLETFLQEGTANPSSCIGCHKFGSVASPPSPNLLAFRGAHHGGRLIRLFAPKRLRAGAAPQAQPTGQPYATDFSFIFGSAQVVNPPPTHH